VSTGQILLYVLLGIVILMYTRRFLLTRGVHQYSPAEVHEMLKGPAVPVLLDVRTDAEHAARHMKGSLHIPLQTLLRRIAELERHRNREIICYCQTGSRSLIAAARLKRLGFRTASMRGGMAEWNFDRRR
jgi:rhodanese-related sulfurtransferase